MSRKPEDWVVEECWEGDGKPGACFVAPGGLNVFVTEWGEPRSTMSKEEFELACRIRDLLRAESAALKRLELAKDALVRTGYFTREEIGDDIGPRIIELWSALRPGISSQNMRV